MEELLDLVYKILGGGDEPTLVYDKFIKVDFLLFPNVIKELQNAGFIVERIDNTIDYAYIKLPVNIAEQALNLILTNDELIKIIKELFKDLEKEIKIEDYVTKVLSIKSPEYEYKISWK